MPNLPRDFDLEETLLTALSLALSSRDGSFEILHGGEQALDTYCQEHNCRWFYITSFRAAILGINDGIVKIGPDHGIPPTFSNTTPATARLAQILNDEYQTIVGQVAGATLGTIQLDQDWIIPAQAPESELNERNITIRQPTQAPFQFAQFSHDVISWLAEHFGIDTDTLPVNAEERDSLLARLEEVPGRPPQPFEQWELGINSFTFTADAGNSDRTETVYGTRGQFEPIFIDDNQNQIYHGMDEESRQPELIPSEAEISETIRGVLERLRQDVINGQVRHSDRREFQTTIRYSDREVSKHGFECEAHTCHEPIDPKSNAEDYDAGLCFCVECGAGYTIVFDEESNVKGLEPFAK